MTVVLQVSDPHFGTEQAPVVAALERLAAAERPDLIVVSGDITQRATLAQFAAARRFLDGLGVPVLAIPGNHDLPLIAFWHRFFRPWGRMQRHFGEALEPVHETADLLLQCLNTTRPWRHEDGEVSAAQVERVARRLAAAAPGQLRIVVVHQPLAVVRESDLANRLHGHAAARRRWAEAGCDLVLGGHIHLPYVLPLTDGARPMWVVQAGTALSTRVRDGAPNSVNLIRCGAAAPAGRCIVEQWNHAAEAAAFVRVAQVEIEPARGPGSAGSAGGPGTPATPGSPGSPGSPDSTKSSGAPASGAAGRTPPAHVG